MTSKNPKKKIVKKVLNKIKPVKKDKDVKTTPPYFPPPYFSTNWGGGNQKASSTDK